MQSAQETLDDDLGQQRREADLGQNRGIEITLRIEPVHASASVGPSAATTARCRRWKSVRACRPQVVKPGEG